MLLVLAWRVDVRHDPTVIYFNIYHAVGESSHDRPRAFWQLAGKKFLKYLGSE